MPNKLGFYLHSSQTNDGLWDLFQQVWRSNPYQWVNDRNYSPSFLSPSGAGIYPAGGQCELTGWIPAPEGDRNDGE